MTPTNRYRTERTDDGAIVFYDDDGCEVARVIPPEGGFTQADLEAFKQFLIAHLHGAN